MFTEVTHDRHVAADNGQFDPRDGQRPRVIAHRGASAAFPENTVAAFAGARDLGADGVELDARRTADGHVIVHHDAHLPDGRAIVDLAAASLPSSIPSLAEAVDASHDMTVNIEIKNWPADPDFDPTQFVADEVVKLAAAGGRKDDLLVSCFHRPTIDHVLAADPDLETAFLYANQDGAAALADAVDHGHHVLHPWDPTVTADLVAAAHARGVRVNVWTVDDPDRMALLARWGVDGIVTNLPDVARTVLDDSGRTVGKQPLQRAVDPAPAAQARGPGWRRERRRPSRHATPRRGSPRTRPQYGRTRSRMAGSWVKASSAVSPR